MNIEKYFEDFIMLDWKSSEMPGGGISWEWEDGASFKAGFVVLSSAEMVIAEAGGMKSQFRLTSKKLLVLERNDIIRRVKDGKLYRITTNQQDAETPDVALVQFATCRAERVD